jgi:D-ribose pyranose/furanose isomerase RbsD
MDALSFSHLSCLSQVEAIQIRSVDWTSLNPTEQTKLRRRFAQFKMLKHLEFDDVTFHDLREVVHIINSFPLLKHISANVCFMKYTEHAVAGASRLPIPRTVETLELGTDDGIPVVLTSLLAQSADPHVTRLNLRNLKAQHLPYLSSVVRRVGSHVCHLLLGMERASFVNVDEGVCDLSVAK